MSNIIRKHVAPKFTKAFTLTGVVTKSADGKCQIEGYANTSAKDRVGDVVLPKAFEKSLPTYMKNPVLLANHDWNDPCGRVTHAEITDKGLFIKAFISSTRKDIQTLIDEGCLSTFSIGYNEVDSEYDEATKTKYIKELELLEISVVTVPANTEASFTTISAKGDSEGDEKADESAKSAKAPTAKELKDFIDTVKSVAGRDLTGTETVAVCDYFISNEEIMTKEQLIAILKAKSVDAAAAPKVAI
jgi:HK97 family phage prohead protease